MIPLLFTGGTISMAHSPAEGGAMPALAPDEVLAATPGIDRVAPGELQTEDWGRFPGPHMTLDRIWALRGRIADLVARPDVRGVVVTHGTDTLEESAYLVARSVETTKPIVFTGAMRTISDAGWDGPANLLDAVRVAADPASGDHGVLVVFGGRIFTALEVAKTNTHLPDAFESPGLGPLGALDDGRVVFRRPPPAIPPVVAGPALGEPVDIVMAAAGTDSRLLDATRETARGLVIAGVGRGNVPPGMWDGVTRWVESGKPVVVSTRVPRGAVGPTYAYHGSARRLVALGAMLAGSIRPQQARIDLLLALGAGLPADQIRRIFTR